jgi:hypothetical protein
MWGLRGDVPPRMGEDFAPCQADIGKLGADTSTSGSATVAFPQSLTQRRSERTPVRAVLGSPSLSVARVVGTISVSIVVGIPHLLVGKMTASPTKSSFDF